jgi:hypothetical protein
MLSVPKVDKFTDPGFMWLNHPESWINSSGEASSVNEEGQSEGSGGRILELSAEKLVFCAPAFKDFWSRTFYTPLLIKSDASGLLVPVAGNIEATISVDFELNPISQFDQAGLLVYIDSNHWLKSGIEYCDGLARLSVVVCNAGFSDWSTQIWPVAAARLRLHKMLQSSSVSVEAAPIGSDDFQFVRVAHLGGPGIDAGDPNTFPEWRIGPFAACPGKQMGCIASFTNFICGPRLETKHSSSL